MIHLSLKTSAKIITFKAEYSMHIYHESKDKFLPLTIYRLPEIYILQAIAHHPCHSCCKHSCPQQGEF